MQQIQTEVLVIGGGATGTGILRDLAMRGFKTVLVERRDLTHGTTGRYHGLLHSGGRYVVKDPDAARECMEENQILRKIMPQCIEDTGGFFVLTPEDDPDYAPRFLSGCHQAGIPVEEITISRMLKQEPLLNRHILRCFQVPDGAADSFLAAHLNELSARQYGATCLTYHNVQHLLVSHQGEQRRVHGASCTNLINGEPVEIHADLVINAAGAWAGKIAASAGIQVQIIPGKGTMVAVNHRVVNTVINRCKLPSDGDILVPAHTVAVMGTTDIKVPDPDHFGVEPWEIRLMLSEGEKIIPGFSQFRLLRCWAGVRPLYQETQATQNRDLTRAYVLLDHAERDHVDGLLTITSGKWTTYRKMAEATVDKACQKLGVQRACRTHLEPLPSPEGHPKPEYHHLGARLAQVEQSKDQGRLICECELATRKDLEASIIQGNAQTLDDIRRDIRLGMGPCQGGFCTYRAAGVLHQLRHLPVEQTNASLFDFLNERWKGQNPVLWGQQLRQARLNELIYIDVLNADHLPGAKYSNLAAEPYAHPEETDSPHSPPTPAASPQQEVDNTFISPHLDVLVIGAGLSGLVAGWQASRRGKKTQVISKGWGAGHWASGCIDVLGYTPDKPDRVVSSPSEGIIELIARHPDHPYALIGLDKIEQAIAEFQTLCTQAGYPLHGSLERNWLLPTALGAIRPTCLAPQTMLAGDITLSQPMLIVGFTQYLDFYAELVADNLCAQNILARGITIDLPGLEEHNALNGTRLARMFEMPGYCTEVAKLIQPHLGNSARVGMPAVLGLNKSTEVLHNLETQLTVPVFEIPGLPPSIPGIRIHNLLIQAIQAAGSRATPGMLVQSADINNRHVNRVCTEAAARQKPHQADQYILATGGVLGGGFIAGQTGELHETVFNLPINSAAHRESITNRSFFSVDGHPIFRYGIRADQSLRPIDALGRVLLDNVFIAGSALDGYDPLRERCLEGVALVTGYWAGKGF